MRYTAGDVLRAPSRVSEWWLELPFRRNAPRLAWWRWLLFEPGQGWLRWAAGERWTVPYGMYEPPEPYTVFPPLRRLCMALHYRAKWPLDCRDDDRRRHGAW